MLVPEDKCDDEEGESERECQHRSCIPLSSGAERTLCPREALCDIEEKDSERSEYANDGEAEEREDGYIVHSLRHSNRGRAKRKDKKRRPAAAFRREWVHLAKL